VSALLAVFFYLMGASRVAVIELSVGAGLVTVLLVFAIGVAGEEGSPRKSPIPAPVSWGASVLAVVLLGWFILPLVAAPAPASEPSLASLLWEGRALDVLLQVVLIFCGVVGVLGLLVEAAAARAPVRKQSAQTPAAQTPAAQTPATRTSAAPGVDSRPGPTAKEGDILL
jgi:hypothetical protein